MCLQMNNIMKMYLWMNNIMKMERVSDRNCKFLQIDEIVNMPSRLGVL